MRCEPLGLGLEARRRLSEWSTRVITLRHRLRAGVYGLMLACGAAHAGGGCAKMVHGAWEVAGVAGEHAAHLCTGHFVRAGMREKESGARMEQE